MQTTTLGRTGLTVSRTAFGCLPIQRVSIQEAGSLLTRAVQGGITFFDTARAYSDSERKIGLALKGMRDKIIIATKTTAQTGEGLLADLRKSLEMLDTDYIDVYQFHDPAFVPKPDGGDGLYRAAMEAKEQGLIRHIGITQHDLGLAEEAVRSGLYDTLQFPFNHLASAEEIKLVLLCQRENIGFICMKALCGGLITDAEVPFSFLSQFPGAVPIWGFQRMEELEQILALSDNPPAMDDGMRARIEADQQALKGSFCRSCGYCLPCPVGIEIPNTNRMRQLITRMPSARWMTEAWQENMRKIEDCTHCGACEKRCPYGLKPYETQPSHLAFYREYIQNNLKK